MIREVFSETTSPVHRISRRSRVVAAVCFSFVVALSHVFPVLYSSLFCSVVLVLTAKLPLLQVVKRLFGLIMFLALIWVVLPVSFKGEPVWSLGFYTASREGVMLAAAVSLKSVAVILAFMALIATMTVSELGRTLNRLGVPPKLVFLLIMTYRYIFVLENEYERLMRSAVIRSFHPGLNLHTFRTYAYLAGMLFVRASVRAERVHQAMKCRGFTGRFHTIGAAEEKGNNAVFAGFAVLTIISLLVMEHLLAS